MNDKIIETGFKSLDNMLGCGLKKGETTLTIYEHDTKAIGEATLFFDSDKLKFSDFEN
jgi:hypothetical protein